MTDREKTTRPDPLNTSPEGILGNTALRAEEKRRLLEDLKYDLVERQTATEENMPDDKGDGNERAELLRRVNLALRSLD